LKREGRHAAFSASTRGAVEVFETSDAVARNRALRNYVALPASRYNTLDGATVARLGDDAFACALGKIDFLGFALRPVLTVKVDVQPEGLGTVIRAERATLRGVAGAEAADDLFAIHSVNGVGRRRVPASDENRSSDD
jgi:hypothetical protein